MAFLANKGTQLSRLVHLSPAPSGAHPRVLAGTQPWVRMAAPEIAYFPTIQYVKTVRKVSSTSEFIVFEKQ